MGNISSGDINNEIEKFFNQTIDRLKNKTNEISKDTENFIQMKSNQIKYDFINQTNKETEKIKSNFISEYNKASIIIQNDLIKTTNNKIDESKNVINSFIISSKNELVNESNKIKDNIINIKDISINGFNKEILEKSKSEINKFENSIKDLGYKIRDNILESVSTIERKLITFKNIMLNDLTNFKNLMVNDLEKTSKKIGYSLELIGNGLKDNLGLVFSSFLSSLQQQNLETTNIILPIVIGGLVVFSFIIFKKK